MASPRPSVEARPTKPARHWPLVVALLVFLADTGLLVLGSVRKCDGRFVYTLDDSYIHMAIARNLVLHGQWGVNSGEFSSSSSSPLWTLLLAGAYRMFGVKELALLVMAVASAVLALGAMHFIMRRAGSPAWLILATLLSIIIFTPLPVLAMGGQEHIAHALLTSLVAFFAASYLAACSPGGKVHGSPLPDTRRPQRNFAALLVLTPLLAAIRYEAMFLILGVCLLLAVRKRFGQAMLFAAVAVAPMAAYGIVSIRHGWFFLPNSVLLKGKMPEFATLGGIFSALGGEAIHSFYVRPELGVLSAANALVLYLQCRRQNGFWKVPAVMAALFLFTAVPHLQFAGPGWFFRYEGYLVAFGLLALGVAAAQLAAGWRWQGPTVRHIPLGLLTAVLLVYPGYRGFTAHRTGPQASKNIYEQQYQMGLFLRKHYGHDAVAINDIGAVSYLSDTRCVDLWGLANMDAARAKLDGSYGPEAIAAVADQSGTRIAIVYDHWYTPYGGLPSQWIPVGFWRIVNNVVCGGPTVSFYALDRRQADRLRENLREFSAILPADVIRYVP